LVIRRHLIAGVVVVLVSTALLVVPAISPHMTPSASAACPAVEVVFARGRTEPAGVGILGNAFVSALRSKTDKNIGVYAVRYPADNEIDVGANDMSAHVQSMANNCPDTRLVLGGYSLGAAVTDVVLAVPMQFFGFKNPLPAGADQHIAAVALFGNGAAWVGPITNFNPSAIPPTQTPGKTIFPPTSPMRISGPEWRTRLPTSPRAGSSRRPADLG
jgi:cutinase